MDEEEEWGSRSARSEGGTDLALPQAGEPVPPLPGSDREKGRGRGK